MTKKIKRGKKDTKNLIKKQKQKREKLKVSMDGGRLKLKSKNSKLLFSTVACTESARTAVVPQRLCSLIKF